MTLAIVLSYMYTYIYIYVYMYVYGGSGPASFCAGLNLWPQERGHVPQRALQEDPKTAGVQPHNGNPEQIETTTCKALEAQIQPVAIYKGRYELHKNHKDTPRLQHGTPVQKPSQTTKYSFVLNFVTLRHRLQTPNIDPVEPKIRSSEALYKAL